MEEVKTYSCIPYYSVEMIVSNTAIKVIREYKGIVESISEVGGMMDLIYLIFSVLYGFYYHGVLAAGIVERVYNLMPLKTIKTQGTRLPRGTNSSQVFPQSPNVRAEAEKYRKIALRTINHKLDIVEISKELIALKAIKHLLFNPKLQELLPLYELKTLHNEIEVSEKNSLQADHQPIAKATSKFSGMRKKSNNSSSFNQQHSGKVATSKFGLTQRIIGIDNSLSGFKNSLKKVSDETKSLRRADSYTNSTSSRQDILAMLRRQIEVKIREELGEVSS
jgi:hypothetical protein